MRKTNWRSPLNIINFYDLHIKSGTIEIVLLKNKTCSRHCFPLNKLYSLNLFFSLSFVFSSTECLLNFLLNVRFKRFSHSNCFSFSLFLLPSLQQVIYSFIFSSFSFSFLLSSCVFLFHRCWFLSDHQPHSHHLRNLSLHQTLRWSCLLRYWN